MYKFQHILKGFPIIVNAPAFLPCSVRFPILCFSVNGWLQQFFNTVLSAQKSLKYMLFRGMLLNARKRVSVFARTFPSRKPLLGEKTFGREGIAIKKRESTYSPST